MPKVPAGTVLTPEGGLGVDLESPPPGVTFTRVTGDSTGILGYACVWLHVEEAAWEYGYRVCSLPWVDAATGEWGISVCPDAEWWAAAYRVRPAEGVRNLRACRVWLVGS